MEAMCSLGKTVDVCGNTDDAAMLASGVLAENGIENNCARHRVGLVWLENAHELWLGFALVTKMSS